MSRIYQRPYSCATEEDSCMSLTFSEYGFDGYEYYICSVFGADVNVIYDLCKRTWKRLITRQSNTIKTSYINYRLEQYLNVFRDRIIYYEAAEWCHQIAKFARKLLNLKSLMILDIYSKIMRISTVLFIPSYLVTRSSFYLINASINYNKLNIII